MAPPEKEYVRTNEDILTVLHHANIDSDSLEKPTQVLYFGDKLKPSLLLELDQNLLQDITTDQTVRFLGRKKEKLVLCTKNSTYNVKSAQTSNSLLIVSDLKFSKDLNHHQETLLERNVCNIHHSYLEIKKIKPDVRMVRIILEKNTYQGPELEPDEFSHETGYLTTEDFVEEIQISEDELLEVFADIDALQVKGYWRLLGFEYHFRALSFLINLIDENSWGLSSIPMGETLKVLSELLPDFIANHIFSIYCIATGAIEDDEQIFELDQKKVCRYLAAALLSHADKFNLDEFLVAWQQGVPEGMEVQLDMIRDMIIIENNVDSSKSISYFPEHVLSGNIHERFQQLFKAKSIWSFEEIEPFLKNLSSEKQDVKALLTKYTRNSKKGNVSYYVSKYGK